jgi:release factor glutamine methyltransferase
MKIELLERLNKQLTQQPDKPEETPESTLRALYYLAKGERVSAVKATSLPLPELNQDEYDNLVSLVEQRCAGIPLAYLTGRQTFMGIEMLSEPQALIPRKETELLAYESLSIVRSLLKAGEPATMIDVCTGSGNSSGDCRS